MLLFVVLDDVVCLVRLLCTGVNETVLLFRLFWWFECCQILDHVLFSGGALSIFVWRLLLIPPLSKGVWSTATFPLTSFLSCRCWYSFAKTSPYTGKFLRRMNVRYSHSRNDNNRYTFFAGLPSRKKQATVMMCPAKFIMNPAILIAIEVTMTNHKTTKTYWYKIFGEISQMNLFLLKKTCWISMLASWISQNPKLGNKTLPGFGSLPTKKSKARLWL